MKKLALLLLIVVSIPVLMVAVEAKNYLFNNSPDQMSFYGFWKLYLPRQWAVTPLRTLLEVFGIASVVALGLTIYRGLVNEEPRWEAELNAEFADGPGYLKVLREIRGNLCLAILIDHAAQLPLSEGEVVNQLLRAADFRCVYITVGLPRNLRLGKVRQRGFEVPQLPAEILELDRGHEGRIRIQVAERWATHEGERVEGVIGSYEWNAFCAVLDRRWIEPDEMNRIYAAVAASPVMPLIGLAGPHPAQPPPTGLREGHATAQSFDETYCRIEQAEIALHRPDLLARVRFMMMVPGLNQHPRARVWRTWPAEQVRSVLQSADEAADLADETPVEEILETVMAGNRDAKRNLLCEAARLLVTAAEIRCVHGNVFRAAYYLQSVAKWYGEIEDELGEELQSEFFYQWWNSFWLSCEPDDRREIRKFESAHPSVRENNTWTILAGYENYLARNPLWPQQPEDPGLAHPEVANVRGLAMVSDSLFRKHGNSFEEAAQSPVFPIPAFYPEQALTLQGMRLLYVRQHLLALRSPEQFASARELLEKRVAELRTDIEPAWLGEHLIAANWALWIEYLRMMDVECNPGNSSEFEQRRAALKTKCEEIRETALVLGFRSIVSRASEMFGWTLMGERSEATAEQVKRIVEAEPYFQETLDTEGVLGWCVSAPSIYSKRFHEISRLNQPSVIPDTVALYGSMKKAGFPPAKLRAFLIKACAVVTNNASTPEHYREQARLCEEEAAVVLLTPDDKSDWVQKTLQGQVICSLSFAASGWIRAGEWDEAERVLEEAENMLKEAETSLGKDDDDIRDVRVSCLLRRAFLAGKRDNHDESMRLLLGCWKEAHPSDMDAGHTLGILVRSEAKVGILFTPGTASSFSEASMNPAFAPSADIVATHAGSLTRYHWRFLQFSSHMPALRVRNEPSFFQMVLIFAELAPQSPLDDDCHNSLLRLLQEAEEFFRCGQASNKDQQRAIRLRGALGAPAADVKQRLREIKEEDRLLGLRERELRNAIAHLNWIEEFPSMDLNAAGAEPPRAQRDYVAESLKCIRQAKTLLLLPDRCGEAVDVLARRAGAMQQDNVRAVDLVLQHEWLRAASPANREPLVNRRNALIEHFVRQHFGKDRTDLIDILRQRFEES